MGCGLMRSAPSMSRLAPPRYSHGGLWIPFLLPLFAFMVPLEAGQEGFSSSSFGPRVLHTRMMEEEEIGLFFDLGLIGKEERVRTGIFSFSSRYSFAFSMASILPGFVTYEGEAAFSVSVPDGGASGGSLTVPVIMSFAEACSASFSWFLAKESHPQAFAFDLSKAIWALSAFRLRIAWRDTGLSGDMSKRYIHHELQAGEALSLFHFEETAWPEGHHLSINPWHHDPYADYDVTFLFGDVAVALRRNGSYEGLIAPLVGLSTLSGAYGFIDSYPGPDEGEAGL